MIDLAQYPNPLMNKPTVMDTGFKSDNYERFMGENLKIINKAKEPVLFEMQPAQASLNDFMEMFYNILVLKARKMGFSSDVLGIATSKFLMGRNEKAISMSFDQTASDKQLARAKYYIKSYEQINGIKVPLKYNSRSQMVWEGKYDLPNGTVEHFQNILQVGSARNTSFGRGDDISFLHLTEVSLAELFELMAGVGEACLPTAHKVLETTAAGFNSYKRFWDAAMMGEIDFACLFYSPYWEYAEDFVTRKRADLGRLGPQEYPLTAEEAFLTSGELYFDNTSLRELLELTREPMKV